MLSFNMLTLQRGRLRQTGLAVIISLLLFSLWSWRRSVESRMGLFDIDSSSLSTGSGDGFLDEAKQAAQRYSSHSILDSDFREVGDRLRVLQTWIKISESRSFNDRQAAEFEDTVEAVIRSVFPFLKESSSSPSSSSSLSESKISGPLRSIRAHFKPKSKGIVIPVGKNNFRYAVHLINNLRDVLKSKLPIQIAYAGDDDLPSLYRDYLHGMGENIESFDVTSVFDDNSLGLAKGGWAIKPFALLGSSFDEVLLLDADVVFMQQPDTILELHPQYKSTGTMLFHDRLIWHGAYPERHQWWEKELANLTLSETTLRSKVFMEGWAEEGDSGVVVADKSRIEVVLGLLHVCWQNTASVRDKWTYRQGYGDKESWWFGFELSGVPYSMEEHYAAILGQQTSEDNPEKSKVCSFAISHLDHTGKLLWYNGSLLKNKKLNPTEFDHPTTWMVDGVWEKGADRTQPSCMSDAEAHPVTIEEKEILEETIRMAQVADGVMMEKFPDVITVSLVIK